MSLELLLGKLYNFIITASKIQVLRLGLIKKGGSAMTYRDGDPNFEEVIYRMTIRLKNGRVIRRTNGRPFRIVIRK